MERPTGVTILAVLGFIATGLLVLAALVVLLGGAMVANMAARPGMGMIAGIGGAIIGVALLGFAVLYAVVGIIPKVAKLGAHIGDRSLRSGRALQWVGRADGPVPFPCTGCHRSSDRSGG